MSGVGSTELLIATIARLLAGCKHIAVGQSSPIPGSGALLARGLSGGALRVSVLGPGAKTSSPTAVSSCSTSRPRAASMHFSGGRRDRRPGQHQPGGPRQPRAHRSSLARFVRSAYLYFLVPRVILFREEHTRRIMVPRSVSSARPARARPASGRAARMRCSPGWACSCTTRPGSASAWTVCTGPHARGDSRQHRVRVRPTRPGPADREAGCKRAGLDPWRDPRGDRRDLSPVCRGAGAAR